MIAGVKVVTEGARGCGYRKVGGTYLISEGISVPCPALPLEVGRCPCCDSGIKPSRGWAWFNPSMFFKFPCPPECPIYQEQGRCEPFKQERAGILWIGGKFYPTPESWMSEAKTMGVSRRISQIPKDLEIGKTWVFVGHREAITKTCDVCDGDGEDYESGAEPDERGKYTCKQCDGTGYVKVAGVFHAFMPTEIQRVVDENVTEKEVEKLLKRGITPVIINRVDENGHSVDEDGELITEPLVEEHATLVDWKPGMHVRITEGREHRFEGFATIVEINQGDKQGVHALVEFDGAGERAERWVFAKDQDISLDAYPNGL
jgi:hypothetical protein